MGEESVRELERRWRSSADPEDEGRWLLARVRAGQLSQVALDAAAWLGVPGAVRAAPGAAERPQGRDQAREPWAALLAWCAGLDARLQTLPEASHRAVLAEAERLLGVLEDPERRAARVIVMLGPRASETHAVPGTLHLDREAGRVEPQAAAFTITLDADGASLQSGAGAVQVDGVAATQARLEHGSRVHTSETTFLVFDAGGHDRLLCRQVRAWLDELSSRVADPRAEPTGLELPDLTRASDHPGSPALSWLRPQLAALQAALAAGRSLPLWPPELSPPHALRPGWAAAIRTAVRDGVAPWLLRGSDPIRSAASSALDRLAITSPCAMTWEMLTPRVDDPRVRDCRACQLQVFDLTQLDRAEATALLGARTGGRLCVRLYRRPDGRVMTRDCATSPGEAWDGGEMGEIGDDVPDELD